MRILGIETSCDETGLAIVEANGGLRSPRFKVLQNLVASQIKIHRPFGGVVPNLAKREHIKNLPMLWQRIKNKELRIRGRKKFSIHSPFSILDSIDLIAVTVGPGLEPALWTGIEFAKNLARDYKKPLIGANHLEGHLYSFLLPQKSRGTKHVSRTRGIFPAIALIVSGGHTTLLLMKSLTKWKKLGETRDDAAGEAFDKVARLLKLPYPGGPEIEKLSKRGKCDAINFPRPMIHDKNYDFSFSGLKTSVLYYLRDNPKTKKADVAASFQQAVIDVLSKKTFLAAKAFRAKSVILSGGVAANKPLRKRMKQMTKIAELKFLVPDFKYNLDNAAMIAAAGYFAHLRQGYGGQAHSRGKKYKLEAQGGLGI